MIKKLDTWPITSPRRTLSVCWPGKHSEFQPLLVSIECLTATHMCADTHTTEKTGSGIWTLCSIFLLSWRTRRRRWTGPTSRMIRPAYEYDKSSRRMPRWTEGPVGLPWWWRTPARETCRRHPARRTLSVPRRRPCGGSCRWRRCDWRATGETWYTVHTPRWRWACQQVPVAARAETQTSRRTHRHFV